MKRTPHLKSLTLKRNLVLEIETRTDKTYQNTECKRKQLTTERPLQAQYPNSLHPSSQGFLSIVPERSPLDAPEMSPSHPS
jgi:hypothetical protein